MSDDQVKSIIDRVQRLQEEKRTIEDDIKEVYAEARGNGYDVKVLRAVVKHLGKDQEEVAEFDAIFDLYLQSYLQAGKPSRAHVARDAGARTREENQNTPERPSNRDLSAVDESSPEAGPQAEASLAGTGSGTLAGREGRTEEHPGSLPEMGVRAAQPIPEQPSVAGTESAVRAGAPAIAGLVADAGWKLPPAKPLRPHCQRPDACGSYGSKHCGGCERAAKSAEADDDGSDVPAFIRKTHDHPSFGEQA